MKNVRPYEDTPLVSIHGFTGSSNNWNILKDEFNGTLLAFDIPGHAKSKFNNLNDNYDYEDFVNDFYLALNKLQLKKINLLGYSMGGRLALSFACKYPKMINHLILESTSIGIEDFEKKEERYNDDIELSASIESSLKKFISKWSNHNLFSNQINRNKNEYVHYLFTSNLCGFTLIIV